MTQVIATQTGYAGGLPRREGDVFDAPRGKDGKEILKATWYRPHEGPYVAPRRAPPPPAGQVVPGSTQDVLARAKAAEPSGEDPIV